MGILQGKVAIVTGGGRGLGRAIALELAAEGASVVVDDIFSTQDGKLAVDEVARTIEAAGGRAMGLTEDVTTTAGAQAMADKTVERFGRIDILVCCAGNTAPGRLMDLEESRWDSVMNLHLKGHFLASKHVLPYMLTQDSGRIITCSSRGSFPALPTSRRGETEERVVPPSVPYATAKAGILGFTAALALELWDTGINVNALLPSATTQLFPGTGPRKVGSVPPPKSLDPEDVAPSVAYLCGPGGDEVSGRFLYAGGGDVVVYPPQLTMDGTRMIRRDGRWPQSELDELLPALF